MKLINNTMTIYYPILFEIPHDTFMIANDNVTWTPLQQNSYLIAGADNWLYDTPLKQNYIQARLLISTPILPISPILNLTSTLNPLLTPTLLLILLLLVTPTA